MRTERSNARCAVRVTVFVCAETEPGSRGAGSREVREPICTHRDTDIRSVIRERVIRKQNENLFKFNVRTPLRILGARRFGRG